MHVAITRPLQPNLHQELQINDQNTLLEQQTNKDSFKCLRRHGQNTPPKNEIDLKLTLRKMNRK